MLTFDRILIIVGWILTIVCWIVDHFKKRLEIKNLKVENKNLNLQNKKLKLEIKKIELEINLLQGEEQAKLIRPFSKEEIEETKEIAKLDPKMKKRLVKISKLSNLTLLILLIWFFASLALAVFFPHVLFRKEKETPVGPPPKEESAPVGPPPKEESAPVKPPSKVDTLPQMPNKVELLQKIETLLQKLRREVRVDTVRINDIYFDYDKSKLKPEFLPELDRLAKILAENPDMAVEISGHTDNMGTYDYNLYLSKRRAQSVVKCLVSLGVDSTRLIAIGYGESESIANNETKEGRAQNRRVEFRFKKQ
jgi:outer membrane protein OmpA-like peptidoglycan-associated protein